VTSIARQLIDSQLISDSTISEEMAIPRADRVLAQQTNGPLSFLRVDGRSSDGHRHRETAPTRHGPITSAGKAMS
jgi:hypothetical protein